MSNQLTRLGWAKTDHAAFQVRTGMMDAALYFFRQIGWLEYVDRKVEGDWGQARFLTPRGYNNHVEVIQLTELSDGDPKKLEMTENHLAIHFSGIATKHAAETIFDWACYASAGKDASIEAANATGTKWFVYLPALFKFALEIV